jgi:hypothetical protein
MYRTSNVTRINDRRRHNIVKQLNLRLLQQEEDTKPNRTA